MVVATMTKIIPLPARQSPAPNKDSLNLAREQKRFLEYLPEKIGALASGWSKLKYINWDVSILRNLNKAADMLHEVSQSLLLTRISDRTAELQQILKQVIDQGFASPHQRQDIDNAIAQLDDTLDMARRYNAKPDDPDTSELPANPVLAIHVALIEEDPHQCAMTRHQLEQTGYQVSIFHHPSEIIEALAHTYFNAILIDTTYYDGPLAGVLWIETHKLTLGDTPIIMLSARSDMVARLRAVRAGALAYVIKTNEVSALHHKIQQTLQYLHHPRDHVLLVDSDASRMTQMEERLLVDGFRVDTLDLPLLLLERLVRLRPDVVVINYALPGCNGVELGHLLRQDPSLMSMPIVYMADLTQNAATREALSLLGNACITLPMDMDTLSTTLRQEIQRARMVASPHISGPEPVAEQRLQHRAAFYAELETLLADANKPENRSTEWYLAYISVDAYPTLKKSLRLRALVEQEETFERYFATRPEIDGLGCSLGEMRYLLVIRDIEGKGGEPLVQRLHAAATRQNQGHFADAGGMSLSIGIAALHTLQSIDDALEQTEQACTRAQRDGGNQIAWTSVVPLRKTQLTTPMRHALRNRSFKLVYQPIVNLDQQDVWFEALVRLVDAQGQVYLPNQFLDWVETDMEGGSFTLDRMVIEQSLQALTHLGGKSGAGYSLVVKLTPDLLQCERLLPYISNVINGARLRGERRTTLSLPESCVMRDIPRARRLVKHIHGLNCGFMLEQVSLTHQTLQQLKELGPIDFIKLNPAWRHQIERDKTYRELIQSVIQLMPDIKLVASHVEDAKSFATLWESGVRYFQGYFIQEPGEKLTAAPFEAAV